MSTPETTFEELARRVDDAVGAAAELDEPARGRNVLHNGLVHHNTCTPLGRVWRNDSFVPRQPKVLEKERRQSLKLLELCKNRFPLFHLLVPVLTHEHIDRVEDTEPRPLDQAQEI